MMDLQGATIAIPVLGGVGMVVAGFIYMMLARKDAGSARMVELATAIEDGAMAFLRREYTVLVLFVGAVALLLGFNLGWNTAIAFLEFLSMRKQAPRAEARSADSRSSSI